MGGHLLQGQKWDCHSLASFIHRRSFGAGKKGISLLFLYIRLFLLGKHFVLGCNLPFRSTHLDADRKVAELLHLRALGWERKTKHRGISAPFLLHGPWRLAHTVFS